jgi:hypothetical protein
VEGVVKSILASIFVAPRAPPVGLVEAVLEEAAAKPPGSLHGGLKGSGCLGVSLFTL